jgi:hypothetical protein
MKSAYGRQIPAPDYELTCVEPGSPMGELMRRYWQPICTSDELRDLPRKEKLLCEEIVLFRDKKGRVGALDPHARIAEPRSNGAASRRRDCAAAITGGSTIRRASASTCRARRRSSARRWMCGSLPTR